MSLSSADSVLRQLALPSFFYDSLPVSLLVPVCVGGLIGWSTRSQVRAKYTAAAGAGAVRAKTFDGRPIVPYARGPAIRPPRWAFGPVWTAIYLSTGYAAWLTLGSEVGPLTSAEAARSVGLSREGARGLYALSLALNFAWMPINFGLDRAGAAVIDIAGLLATLSLGLLPLWSAWTRAAVAQLTPSSGPVTTISAYLPQVAATAYLGWTAFATYLNTSFWYLNR
ncbi:hypothetical protein PYCC9005_001957 [Savitreella phatthalungensis]